MLTIRKSQNAALAEAMGRRFENKVFVHLNKFWPEQCRSQGGVAVRETIRSGQGRANEYGMKTENDVARYVDLMYSLGHDFDSDPALPWVPEILNDNEISPTVRMDRLYEEAEKRLV